MNSFKVLLISLILSSLVFAARSKLPIEMVEIVDLHPTQAVAGFREVKRKKKKIEEFKTNTDRDDYFKKNKVPVVVGPGGQYYMIDHHHFTLAALQVGYKEVYCHVVADFSKSTVQQFWRKMITKSWVYLKDNGRKFSVYDLPQSIDLLTDDPYRSLAGRARQEGAYDKTYEPFVEFLWADFFRSRIPKRLVEKNFKQAVSQAMRISQSAEAKHLPGHKARGACFEVYAAGSH